MNIALWIIQILLAFAFIYHGWMMLSLPPQARKGGPMDYVEAIPPGLRRFTAVAVRLTLETFSFQAPEFYQKLGYNEFGVIDGFGNHFRKFYMQKRLQ